MAKSIKSVATKPITDKLFGTKLTWQPGDTHTIEDVLANKLLKRYSDVLTIARGRIGNDVFKIPEDLKKDKLGDFDDQRYTIEKMGKKELRQFAYTNFNGFKFEKSMDLAVMKKDVLSMFDRFGTGE